METTVEHKVGKIKKGFLRTLRILLAIYAVLYVIFITDNIVPRSNFNPWDIENIAIKVLFVVFVLGYIISWKYELTAGVIFILWFIGMCYQNFFLCTTDCGAGIVMGIPLLIFGILFIVYARRKIS
jgi:hypothetical protein